MRLGSLRRDGSDGRDGALVVVSRDGARCLGAQEVAPTLQAALDDWERAAPGLRALAARLERDRTAGGPLDPAALAAPLPRAYEWLDGSAFLSHVRLVRRSRGVEPPPDLLTNPLMYQGGGGAMLGPRDPVVSVDPDFGLDFEGEIGVILGDVPLGTSAARAGAGVRLLCLLNDVSLRTLAPAELAKGFGFVQSKPPTAFAPWAVTPDELGDAWRGGRLHLRLRCQRNGALVGDCDAGEMHFSFFDLIAHAARTRPLVAGTIIGSGTVSNEDPARGISCLVEQRMKETLATGAASTPYLVVGDTVRLEVLAADGTSVFGAIEQTVRAA